MKARTYLGQHRPTHYVITVLSIIKLTSKGQPIYQYNSTITESLFHQRPTNEPPKLIKHCHHPVTIWSSPFDPDPQIRVPDFSKTCSWGFRHSSWGCTKILILPAILRTFSHKPHVNFCLILDWVYEDSWKWRTPRMSPISLCVTEISLCQSSI